MSGVCGWLGPEPGGGATPFESMLRLSAGTSAIGRSSQMGPNFGLGAVGPPGTAYLLSQGEITLAWHGHPFWMDEPRADAIELSRRFIAAYLEQSAFPANRIGGDFALALIDRGRRTVLLAVDRIGIRNVVYAADRERIVFGPSCDVVAAWPQNDRQIDPQAIYDYVYFHMVPGPGTVYRGMKRLLPGHCLVFRDGQIEVTSYWRMRFAEDSQADTLMLRTRFRDALRTGVGAFASSEGSGAFLSGGTDSSTVSGLLGGVTGAPAKTYSIGFEAAGYDEMEYARIAARHFGTEHHEYYVTPADVVAAVPVVAAAYDQPFGNASAVPTYYCAKQARANGVLRMLAGDGGDELFGGNARYARQVQLAQYESVPRVVRERVIEPLLLNGTWAAKVPLARKGRSYVEQARLPMPARYETYNLLERLGPGSVFDADFLSRIDRGHPQAMLKATYDSVQAESLINRMLGLDLKFTLADNDLPKVTRMCDAAGVDVAFPMLHESVVEFSASLAPELKLRGTKLRYLFKEALRDFLPAEIIHKQKHGFGLPAGLWIRDYRPLGELAADAMARLRKRGIFRPEFLEALLTDRVRAHPGYYGTMAWILMMLELWFEKHSGSGPLTTSTSLA